MKPLGVYPEKADTTVASVRSVNRINIRNPGVFVSNWLDVWSVVYLSPTLAENYAAYYNFWNGFKGKYERYREFDFSKSGNYVAQQCEGRIENFQTDGARWIQDEEKGYGYNTGGSLDALKKPSSPWPITK